MSYTNTWETDGLYRNFTGTIAGDEILKANFELHEDPGFQYIKYIINDFTEVKDHAIEAFHTKAYALTDEIISNTKGNLKIALVVTQEPYIALANSYREQMIGNRFECEIFRSVKDARIWVSDAKQYN